MHTSDVYMGNLGGPKGSLGMAWNRVGGIGGGGRVDKMLVQDLFSTEMQRLRCIPPKETADELDDFMARFEALKRK